MAEVGRWKPYTQRQGQLLSALEDALDPGDPVFVINDAVDSLALTPLEQRYAMLGARGQRPARWPQGPETQRIHRLVRLPWARARYARRKTQAERPHAEIAGAGFNLPPPCAFAIACG